MSGLFGAVYYRSFDGRKFGGAKRDRTADLLHAMQALSQLSYSPIRPFQAVVTKALFGLGGGCLLLPVRIGKQEFRSGGLFFVRPEQMRSDFVVVRVHADQVGHVIVVFVFVLGEERVVVVVIDIDFIIAEVRNVFAGCGCFVVGFLE